MNRFYDSVGASSIQFAPWELKTRALGKNRAIFLLQADIKFYSDVAGGDIVVPVGFLSDLASIPTLAWGVFMAPDNPHISLGGWVHDFLYGSVGSVTINGVVKHLTRKQCDTILAYEAMKELGASKFQQNIVYFALRAGGAGSFNTAPPNIRWKFVHIPQAKLGFVKPQ